MTKIQRNKVNAYLRRSLMVPFAWGSHDCMIFVFDAIREATGVDYAKNYRGKYSTELEAQKLIGKEGLKGKLDSLASVHGWISCAPSSAQWGDVGILWHCRRQALCLCIGARVAVPGPRGMETRGRTQCSRFWRVV